MDQICLVVPITPGKTADARDFMRELEELRKPDYDRSERRIGITKEAWYLARTSGGDQFVTYMESPDFGQALSLFSGSQDEFDLWFKRRLADSTGLDLNTRPAGRRPSSYRAIPHSRSPRHRQATKVSASIWAGTAIPAGSGPASSSRARHNRKLRGPSSKRRMPGAAHCARSWAPRSWSCGRPRTKVGYSTISFAESARATRSTRWYA
jgi:Family of unknown function (DUF6176)